MKTKKKEETIEIKIFLKAKMNYKNNLQYKMYHSYLIKIIEL